MNYQFFIEAVLGGHSVNARAKQLQIPQVTLSNYKLSKALPPYTVARRLAIEAGLGDRLGDVFNAIADEEERRKKEKTDKGGA